MKNSVFWVVMPCSPLKVNQCFGGTCRLPLHGRRICQTRKQLEGVSGHVGLLIFWPWKWRRHVPPKRGFTFNGLHGVTSQKMVSFITTGVRTSNPYIHHSYRFLYCSVTMPRLVGVGTRFTLLMFVQASVYWPRGHKKLVETSQVETS
jgi:hypothetical protein